MQQALNGLDLFQAGKGLTGPYQKVWQMIVRRVELKGIPESVLDDMVEKALAILGSHKKDQVDHLEDDLHRVRNLAVSAGAYQMIRLVDTIFGLIDAQGNPEGLGTRLTGSYAETWQKLIRQLNL